MTVHGTGYIVHVWQCISNLMSVFCVSYHDYHFVGRGVFFSSSVHIDDIVDVDNSHPLNAICKTIS